MNEAFKICKFCQKNSNDDKRVCEPCIAERRPKLSIGLLVFLGFLGLVPAVIYWFYKKDQQEQWDKENL